MLRGGLILALVFGVICSYQQAAVAQTASKRAPWSVISILAANGARALGITRTSRKSKNKGARRPEPIPPLPERKNANGKSDAVLKPAPDVWQPGEIKAAQARCSKLLKGIDAVAVPQPPFKEGKCGAAAPIRLIGLGRKPQVKFSPPALVTCDMAAALHTWIRKDLQPLAKKHLGERIAKVEVMSDYSCRPAMGRAGNPLSEHAFADALDIRGFVTQTGRKVRVLEKWGETRRDIAAKVEAAQAKAQTAASDEGGAKVAIALPISRKAATAARLGGPASPQEDRGKDRLPKLATLSPQVPASPAPGPRTRFLHAAHAAACRIFGTTLGPEANEAHRNHFHVDMAERTYKKICD